MRGTKAPKAPPKVLSLLDQLAVGKTVYRDANPRDGFWINNAGRTRSDTVHRAIKAGYVRLVPTRVRRFADAQLVLTPRGKSAVNTDTVLAAEASGAKLHLSDDGWVVRDQRAKELWQRFFATKDAAARAYILNLAENKFG
jgi:hypothetical protein